MASQRERLGKYFYPFDFPKSHGFHALFYYLAIPDDLILTGFFYENDADMDALKHATFLADDNCGGRKGINTSLSGPSICGFKRSYNNHGISA